MVNFILINDNSEEEAKKEYFALLQKYKFELELYSEQSDDSIYIIFSEYVSEFDLAIEKQNIEEIEKHLKFIRDLSNSKNSFLNNILEISIYPVLEAKGIEESKYR